MSKQWTADPIDATRPDSATRWRAEIGELRFVGCVMVVSPLPERLEMAEMAWTGRSSHVRRWLASIDQPITGREKVSNTNEQ